MGGQTAFIGQATELKRGLAKRLSALRSASSSGRSHYAGRLAYEHRASISVEVLIVGDDESAQKLARLLKTQMVARHKPKWNASNANRVAEQKRLACLAASRRSARRRRRPASKVNAGISASA
jgi:hypothetical protein